MSDTPNPDTALGPDEPDEQPEQTTRRKPRMSGRRPPGLARFTSLYGASPLHLLALIGTLVVSLYAAKRIYDTDPNWHRYAIWFFGAALFHDLVLAPTYMAADRALGTLRARLPSARPGLVNYIRFPVVISGLLFLVFYSAIADRGEGALLRASGLDPGPYLGRWLVVTAVLFAASGLVYAVNLLRSARR